MKSDLINFRSIQLVVVDRFLQVQFGLTMWFERVWVLVEGRGSRVEGRKSRVEGNMSRVSLGFGRGSRVESRGLKKKLKKINKKILKKI